MAKKIDLTEFDRIRKDLDNLIVDGKYIGKGQKEANTVPLCLCLLHNVVNINTNDVKHFIREYTGANNSRVDFCIKFSNEVNVLVELKPWDECPSKEKWLHQIENYMVTMPEADFIIITNGRQWHFYKREIMQRLFFFLNIDMDDIEKRELNINRLQTLFNSNFEDLASIYQWGSELSNETYNKFPHSITYASTTQIKTIITKNDDTNIKYIINDANKFYTIWNRHNKQKDMYSSLTSSERDQFKKDKRYLNDAILITPKNVVEKIVEDVKPITNQKILINVKTLEDGRNFVDTLIRTNRIINTQNIIITCSYRIYGIEPDKNENVYYMDNEKSVKDVMKMKFDHIIQNPPYSGTLHLDYFEWGYNLQKKNKAKMSIVMPNILFGDIRMEEKSVRNANRVRKLRELIDFDKSSTNVIVENYNYDFHTNSYYEHTIIFFDFAEKHQEALIEYFGINKTITSISYETNPYGDLRTIDKIVQKIIVGFPDKMCNHIVTPNRNYKTGTYFTKYADFIGASGGGFAGSYGGTLQKAPALSDAGKFDSEFGTFVTAYIAPNWHPTDNNILPNKIYSNNAFDGSKGDKKIDNLFGTKEELENHKWNSINNPIPLFLNMIYTIDMHNRTKKIMPWMVEKKYSAKEAFDKCNLTKEERILVIKTILLHKRDEAYYRRFLLGTNQQLIDMLKNTGTKNSDEGIPQHIKESLKIPTDAEVIEYTNKCEIQAINYVNRYC